MHNGLRHSQYHTPSRASSALPNVLHRSLILIPGPEYVVYSSDNQHPSVSQAGPVHALSGWVSHSWEETHDKSQEEKGNRGKVDRKPQATQVKCTVEERLLSQATEGDAAD